MDIQSGKDSNPGTIRNADTIITLKTKFLTIEIEQDETLNPFGDRFYHQAQVLMGSKAIANYDTKIAMIHAVKSHSELHKVMLPVLLHKYSFFEMVEHLQRCDTIMGANKLCTKQIHNLESKERTTNSCELDYLYNHLDGHTDCNTSCPSSNSQA